jgi:hypothetical protein
LNCAAAVSCQTPACNGPETPVDSTSFFSTAALVFPSSCLANRCYIVPLGCASDFCFAIPKPQTQLGVSKLAVLFHSVISNILKTIRNSDFFFSSSCKETNLDTVIMMSMMALPPPRPLEAAAAYPAFLYNSVYYPPYGAASIWPVRKTLNCLLFLLFSFSFKY